MATYTIMISKEQRELIADILQAYDISDCDPAVSEEISLLADDFEHGEWSETAINCLVDINAAF